MFFAHNKTIQIFFYANFLLYTFVQAQFVITLLISYHARWSYSSDLVWLSLGFYLSCDHRQLFMMHWHAIPPIFHLFYFLSFPLTIFLQILLLTFSVIRTFFYFFLFSAFSACLHHAYCHILCNFFSSLKHFAFTSNFIFVQSLYNNY